MVMCLETKWIEGAELKQNAEKLGTPYYSKEVLSLSLCSSKEKMLKILHSEVQDLRANTRKTNRVRFLCG